MDEGTSLEETSIGPGDILRNRYWIINIVWSGISILLVWWIMVSGFFLYLFNPFGIIFFFIEIRDFIAPFIRFVLEFWFVIVVLVV